MEEDNMGYGKFKINGVSIKNPSTFKISNYKTSSLARLASGKMVGDQLGRERKLYFTYKAISAADLQCILDAIFWNDGMFFPVEYVESIGGASPIVRSMSCYVGEISQTLVRDNQAVDSQWIWKDVSFNLISQFNCR